MRGSILAGAGIREMDEAEKNAEENDFMARHLKSFMVIAAEVSVRGK